MAEPIGWIPSEAERTGRAPTARKAWGTFGCAVAGGFFLGALIEWDNEAMGGRVLGVVIAAPVFLIAALGLMIQIRQRVRAGIVACLALVGFSVAAGLEWAFAMSYDITGPPPQDMGKAIASTQGKAAMILLPIAIAMALYFSYRRFPLKEEGRNPKSQAVTN